MRLYGLIGCPLEHSLSVKYFSEKFAREGISDCRYENFQIADIKDFLLLSRDHRDLEGLNVTIPYKTAIIEYLDSVDRQVSDIQAANVVRFFRHGSSFSTHGYNTDIDGIRESLLPFVKYNLKRSLVLGTGGASKAVRYVMGQLGIEVINVSRQRSEVAICYEDINGDVMEDVDIVINTTPLGMYPNVDTKPHIDYDLLNNKKHILFDIVYNPEITAFLNEGRKRGCKIITGVEMFNTQAELTWKIWNS